jgi:hypothetical protein
LLRKSTRKRESSRGRIKWDLNLLIEPSPQRSLLPLAPKMNRLPTFFWVHQERWSDNPHMSNKPSKAQVSISFLTNQGAEVFSIT